MSIHKITDGTCLVASDKVRIIKVNENDYLLVLIKSESISTLEAIDNLFDLYWLNASAYRIIHYCNYPITVKRIKKHFTYFREYDLDNFLKKMVKIGILRIKNHDMKIQSRRIIECFPSFIDWTITRKCNLKCEHCSQNSSPLVSEESISFEDAKKIIDKLYEFGVIHITFTGGEPMLVDDFLKILRYAYRLGFFIEIDTNGSILTPHMINSLKAMRDRVHFNISLDSHVPEVHDSFRGCPGLFNKIKEVIYHLRKNNISVRVSTVLTKRNINELESMCSFLRKLGIREWAVSHIHPIGRAQSNYSKRFPSPEEIVKAYYTLYLLSKKFVDINIKFPLNPARFPNTPSLPRFICEHDGLRTTTSIDEKGYVYLCSGIEESCLGNINELDRESILKKARKNWLWNATVNDLIECPSCELKNICNGGCRAIAKVTSGDTKRCDLIAKELIEAFIEIIVPKLPIKIRRTFYNIIRNF